MASLAYKNTKIPNNPSRFIHNYKTNKNLIKDIKKN